MRSFLIACILVASYAGPATAEGPDVDEKHIESQNELGGVIPIGEGRFGHRVLGRLFLNVDDTTTAAEAHYGLAWKIRERVTMDFTVGYVFTSGEVDSGHALAFGVWNETEFGRHWRFRVEQMHLYDGKYRYEGFYAIDYAVGGVHLENRGRDVAAGFHFGSGTGLDPFRVEIRLTHGLTDGFPEDSGRFFMAMDFR